jgi:hypothetical protein
MNLRKLLLDSGLDPLDLKQAVEEARSFTRGVVTVAGLAEQALVGVAKRMKDGKKARTWVVHGATVAGIVRDGASTMLAERGRHK